jgi:hypothetical protein
LSKLTETEVEVNVVGVDRGGCLFAISVMIGVHAFATKRDETLAASYSFLVTEAGMTMHKGSQRGGRPCQEEA